ncbi:MAG: hypothetical protein HYS25_06860 [Ignavibacteriales bacterium]|nr:hypothetical protein [Ignavibacteriales bacterium]
MPTKKKPATIIWIFAALALIGLLNSLRQYYVGSGAIAERLAMFSFAEGLLATIAAWSLWKRTKWAWIVILVWAVETLAWGVIGTLIVLRGMPFIEMSPGMLAVTIGVAYISFKARRHIKTN